MAGNLLLFALLALFGPGDVGTTAFPLLKVPVSPRACAMGETYTGLAPDVSALFWNPAGLGRFSAAQFGVSHQEWFLGTRDENLAACLPLGPGCLGAGLVYSGTEGIETWDPENNRGDTLSLRSGYALVGYGVTVARRLNLGLTIKGMYDELTRASGMGACADVGVLYQLTYRLSLGMTGQNLGPKMRYGSETYLLPTAIRVGAGYTTPRFRLLLDGSVPIDNWPSIHLGGEYELSRLLELRAGARLGPHDWQTLTWASLFTAGLGLNLDRLHLDYALVPYGPLGLTHRLGLRFDLRPSEFGRVRIQTSEFKTGKPLSARFVLSGVQQGESNTDGQGSFLLAGVETGWLKVTARTDEHNPATDSVLVEPRVTRDLKLALHKAGFGSLWVAVYDAGTRRSLTAQVSYTGPTSGAVSTSDTAGSSVLRKLPAGDYEFTASACDSCHQSQCATITIEPEHLTSHSFLLEILQLTPSADSLPGEQGTVPPDSSGATPASSESEPAASPESR